MTEEIDLGGITVPAAEWDSTPDSIKQALHSLLDERRTHNVQEEKPICEISCFISSPFSARFGEIHAILSESVSEKVEKITSENVQFRQTFRLIWNRLDNAPFIAQNIQRNVLSSIEKSHLLVADITPQFTKKKKNESDKQSKASAPNPSVMHEIGFATALGIPIFLIGERGTSKYLPANLKGFLVSEYDRKLISKRGQVTLSTDAETSMDDKYDGAEERDNFSRNLAETITNVILMAGAPLTPGAFVVNGYRSRRAVDLPYLIKNSKYRVYILTTNIDYVNDRLLDDIRYALEFNTKPKDGYQEPLNRSYKVDILTMDPESIVTNARAKQLSASVATFRDILRQSLEKMIKFAKDFSDNVEIATYVSLPTLILFVIDDMIVFSVPFPSQQSRLVPHFVISHDDVAIQQFVSYFFSVKSQAGKEILL
jgi:hypothetical protein